MDKIAKTLFRVFERLKESAEGRKGKLFPKASLPPLCN
jgi:hypothetical protein